MECHCHYKRVMEQIISCQCAFDGVCKGLHSSSLANVISIVFYTSQGLYTAIMAQFYCVDVARILKENNTKQTMACDPVPQTSAGNSKMEISNGNLPFVFPSNMKHKKVKLTAIVFLINNLSLNNFCLGTNCYVHSTSPGRRVQRIGKRTKCQRAELTSDFIFRTIQGISIAPSTLWALARECTAT